MEPTPSTIGHETSLWQGLEALGRRVEALERRVLPDPEIGYQPSAEEIDSALRITETIFPGEVGFSLLADPDYPGYQYPVVSATATGDIKENEDRRLLWHRKIQDAIKTDVIWRLALRYTS